MVRTKLHSRTSSAGGFVEGQRLSGARSEEEFFDKEAGEASRVMAKDAVFFQEIVSDEADFSL
jgi:hypothetical protein